MKTNIQTDQILEELNKKTDLIRKLNRIGVELSAAHDTEELLGFILEESMEITSSDAGSIFIKKETEDGPFLEFAITRNTSKDIPFNKFMMPINTESIAGAAVINKEKYNFVSMDELPAILGIKHNKSFDEANNYRTCNMLVIPMMNIENDVLGVMQLINKKTDFYLILEEPETFLEHIVSYTAEEEELISSLSAQTAILLERSLLLEEIQTLFRSFIESMVTTIDQRDPVTAGHSLRVGNFSLALARAVSGIDYGPYKNTSFSEDELTEIYYAGLLHDVGKIGVKEDILTKRNKLPDLSLELINYRIHLLREELQRKDMRTAAEDILLGELDTYPEFIDSLNRKGFLPDDEEQRIKQIAALEFIDIDGEKKPLLSARELEMLTIKAGNLSAGERTAIEQHAAHTYEIISQITWSKNLQNIAAIAADHHEKLNGRGYPRGLKEEQISLGARIMAIADIFDALTASDRPYKPAMPVDKVLGILREEADAGHLDPAVVDIFIREKPYLEVMEVKQ